MAIPRKKNKPVVEYEGHRSLTNVPVDHPDYDFTPIGLRSDHSVKKAMADGTLPTMVGPRSSLEDRYVELRRQIATFIEKWARPYQLRWLMDRSKQKAASWTRRGGKSQTLSLESDLQAMEPPKASDYSVVMMSAGDTPAKELLLKSTVWANFFNDLALRVVGKSIFFRPPSASQLWFWNGNRVLSLPANPLTAPGFTGDVLWDEAAKTPRDELIYEAIHPNITSNAAFSMRVASTPFGEQGVFWKIMSGQIPGWSLHVVDLITAIKEGDPRDFEEVRRSYSKLVFDQNFLCKFISTAALAFSPELIRSALGLELPPVPEVGSAATINGFSPRIVVGADIGRRSDLTSFVWAIEWPKGYYRPIKVLPLENVAFAEQEAKARRILVDDSIEAFVIDETGLGMHLAENLKRDFPGKVKPVTFNNTVKSNMINTVLGLMEQGRVGLVDDERLLDDFQSIRRKLLPSGILTFDASRNERGHADSFTAFALALTYLSGSDAEWRMGIIDDTGHEIVPSSEGISVRSILGGSTPGPGLARNKSYPSGFRGASGFPIADTLGAESVPDDIVERLNAARRNPEEQRRILEEAGLLEY